MSVPLRVGVNLLWLVPGVVGGSEGYATNLLELLAPRAAAAGVELTAFALPTFTRRYPELAARLSTVTAPLPDGRHVVRRVAIENSWLARQSAARKLDVVHHLGGVVPPLSNTPAVVTLHDLQYLAYPEYFTATKRRYLAAVQGRSLHRARVVVAISEFTAGQAIERFGLDPAKVVVVPPRVRDFGNVAESLRAGIRTAFDLPGDFVLYPAATYPHKNHLVLLRAFADVAREHEVTLVLTGAAGAGAWGSAHSTEPQVRALAEELGISDRVRLLGYVPDDQLAALYAEAAMLAFPSKFEGFGLPVVEAMSAGCPVVVADSTALPGVVGDAGVLVEPDDAAAWVKAISRLLDDPGERERLRAAGLARAAVLAADDPVDTLVSAYREAAA